MKPFLVVFAILIQYAVLANHTEGYEISYQKLPGNSKLFLLELKVYYHYYALVSATEKVEASSPTFGTSNWTLKLRSIDTLKTLCGATKHIGSYSDTVTLPGIDNLGWVISHYTGNRSNLQTNLVDFQYTYISTRIKPLQGTSYSTPEFAIHDYVMEAGQSNSLNFAAINRGEADSLYYLLENPKDSAGLDAVYATGYSFTEPFGTGVKWHLDSLTGVLVVDQPLIGYYTLAVSVKSYKNGQFVAVTKRDVIIFCTATLGDRPKLTIPNKAGVPGYLSDSLNRFVFEINEGSILQFNIDAIVTKVNSVYPSVKEGLYGLNISSINGGSCKGMFCPSVQRLSHVAGASTYQFTYQPDSNFVPHGLMEKKNILVFETLINDSCNIIVGERLTFEIIVKPASFMIENFYFELCQGDTLNPIVRGDTTQLLWSPSFGVSDTTSGSPKLYPTSSTSYTLTNLNDGSVQEFYVKVGKPQPWFILQNDGESLSYVPLKSKKNSWYYNGAKVAVDQSKYKLVLPGSYEAVLEDSICLRSSKPSVHKNPSIVSLSTDQNGGSVIEENVSEVKVTASSLMKGRILTNIHLLIPDSTVKKTNAVQKLEIIDPTSGMVLLGVTLSEIHQGYYSSSGFSLNLVQGKNYEFLITSNDQTMLLYQPSAMPFIDKDQQVKVEKTEVVRNGQTNLQHLYPYMGFEFKSGLHQHELEVNSLQVYPNPFSEQVAIDIEGEGQIVISDLTGKVVLTSALSGPTSINTTQLKRGVYLYLIKSEGIEKVGKLIKL